jgi:hypothetical protein
LTFELPTGGLRVNSEDAHEPVNVHKTVGYRHDRLFLAHIPMALLLGLLGLTMFAFSERNTAGHFLAASILIAACIAWIVYAFYRRAHPSKPVIELSPLGLLFRIPGVKEVRIPWREISAIETMDTRMFFPSLVRPRFLHYRNVTAIRVSRAFYDRKIHVASAFMRGPGWGNVFFPEEKSARVALHHEALDVPPQDLRREVEARWKAFGPQSSAFADERREQEDGERVAATAPKLARAAPETRSAGIGLGQIWYAIKIVVLLTGIAAMLGNILGYWQTDSQRQDRAEHDYWQEQYRKWDEEEKRSAEERRQKDKEWEEFWKKQNF